MTDPNPDLDPDEVEQANVAAAAIAGFTLAQFAFGELIKSGILARGDAEHLLKQAIETHETAGPGNRGAAELLAVVLQSLSAIQPPTRQSVGLVGSRGCGGDESGTWRASKRRGWRPVLATRSFATGPAIYNVGRRLFGSRFVGRGTIAAHATQIRCSPG